MKVCVICGSEHTKLGKTCNKFCMRQLISNSCRGKTGGYREGSGRAKTGYYKGIYCGSTYELCWVIYQLDHHIAFSRFDGCIESGGRKYFPDFLQNNKIVEIKGFEHKASVDRKTKIANEHGYEVIVLRKPDLKHCFDWVTNKYTKKYETLYDGHKPKYNYVCECCNIAFTREHENVAKFKTCSRSCSLKMNRIVSGQNQYTKSRDVASVAIRPSP